MQRSKKILQAVDKYLAFGFDADHCLVRYKLGETFATLYKRMAKILVEQKSYPKEMLEFGQKERRFILNGLVMDYKTAYIMKLGENKIITRAYYGYDRVSREDLEAKFGNPPKYEIFDPYNCQTDRYLCCVSFLECYIPALLAHMVEYKKDKNHPEQLDVKAILEDAQYAAKKLLVDFVTDIVTGKQELDNLLYKQDKLKNILLKLKEKGKMLFIVSNALAPYHAVVMQYAFGKDWASLFDFIISDANKPKFFLSQDTPFYELDAHFKKIDKGVTVIDPSKLYVGGNAKLLEENMARIAPGKSGRILFFGDNYSTDVLAAEKIDHWDGVCIIEELGDVNFGEGYDETVWGNWRYEDTPYGTIPTFWYSYMSKNVAMCASLVDSVEMAAFYGIE